MLKPLLIILLPTVALGCIVGILAGKHRVKQLTGQLNPLLTGRQRAIYSASILFGVICLLLGFFYAPGSKGGGMDEENYPVEIPLPDEFYGKGEPGMGEYGTVEIPVQNEFPEAGEGEFLEYEQDEALDGGEIEALENGEDDALEAGEDSDSEAAEDNAATGNGGGTVVVSPPKASGGTVRYAPAPAIRVR